MSVQCIVTRTGCLHNKIYLWTEEFQTKRTYIYRESW